MSRLVDVGYAFGALLYSPALLARTAMGRGRLGSWGERLGDVPRRAGDRPCIWVHGVSVGEINATRGLVERFCRDADACDLVVSTTTDTGYARARALYPDLLVFRYPLDFTVAVQRALRRIRPSLIVLMELEVWYNLLALADRAGVPTVVVNGRLTERSTRRFGWISPIARRMFSRLTWVGAQSPEFAERFERVGVPADRIEVTGSLKWDTAAVEDRIEGDEALAREVGLSTSRPILVAGSTGPGEEAVVLDAYDRMRVARPDLQLLVVPRKPERFDAVADLMVERGYACIRRSERLDGLGAVDDSQPTVFLCDTMGELRKCYSLADVVFVGRTLIPLGGSDMMEVAALARPVLAGPHTENFPQAARALIEGGGMITVRDANELADTVLRLLNDDEYRSRLGAGAREVVLANQGSTERTCRRLQTILAQCTSANPLPA